MAKRRRLIPSPLAGDFDPDRAESPPSPLEVKAFLRPSLGAGVTPPIARVAQDAATQAALDEVSAVLAKARAEGRLVQALPLEAIDMGHLVRDRIGIDEEELGHLIASIAAHGQRTPIEVTDLGQGRYGLISGWRRMQALMRLSETTQDAKFGSVLALLRRPSEASETYVAMVEENEVRLGLSYYERARIAARAVDLGVFETEKQALQRLFASASRARRSKIGSFLGLYRALDPVLRFPAAIPERLGLALAKALDDAPTRLEGLCLALAAHPARDAAEEQTRLAGFIAGKTVSDPAKTADVASPPKRQELQPGVFLEVSGGWTKPVLTILGPNVGPAFRERLESWLREG